MRQIVLLFGQADWGVVDDLVEVLAEAVAGAERDAGADVVFSYTVGVENAVIANGRKELKWKVPQVGAWTLSFPFFINGAKEAAEGAMIAHLEGSRERLVP